MQPEGGAIVAGRYRLERPLAQGAMGCVWVARHLQLDVDVAVKLMAPSYAESTEARARFEREAKASALLKIPNAVHVYDYGIETGSPFLVMELLEGEDLAARLRRKLRLSLAETLAVLEPIGKALRRAHEIGLVHRDLKPGNVFIARHGGEEIVKVVDFGIAKASGLGLDAHATKTGSLLGSPRYMSPEQVRSSSQVDHRSDLWSFGVIAFECATGQVPFLGEEVGEVLVEVCTAPIPRASEVAPWLGPEVNRFFDRALTRDPNQRFQSASELVEAFAELVNGGAARAPSAQSTPGFPPAAQSAPGFAPAAQSAPGFAPAVQSAPGFAPAVQSAPGFAPAVQSTPGLSPNAQSGPGLTVQAAPGFAPQPIVSPAATYDAPPAVGTLSPAASTHGPATAPSSGGRAMIALVSALGGALLLGAILFFATRSPATGAPPAAPTMTSAEPAPIPSATITSDTPPTTASAPATTSSTAAAASASVSSDPKTRAPVRPGARGTASPSKQNDLLNHM